MQATETQSLRPENDYRGEKIETNETRLPLKAVHLGGGNQFDDIRLDIAKSYKTQDLWLEKTAKKSVSRSKLRNYFALTCFYILKKLDLNDFLIQTGLAKNWFKEFNSYWTECLEGRPITVMDFYQLLFNYRKMNQNADEMSWESDSQHIKNWQEPRNISLTLHYALKYARQPFRSKYLFKYIKPKMRAFEYGCAAAPIYRTYRNFLSHRDCEWIIADIPNFPFHYARHVYANDAKLKMITLYEDRLDDPLRGVDGELDIIFMEEVFEHLHSPLHIIQYLTKRLKSGGHLFFDYILSDGEGLDTPKGITERESALQFIAEHYTIVEGDFKVAPVNISRCVARKN